MTKTGLYIGLVVAIGLVSMPSLQVRAGNDQMAAGEPAKSASDADDKKELTPEEKMQARFPQPAKVGHLIGLPVLDGSDSTIGYVQEVVRTSDGRVKLIVPYGDRFGWARNNTWLASGRRPVAVPIEAVEILALQINAVDMDRSAFKNSPTWSSKESVLLSPDDVIRIGIGRR